MTLSRHHRHRHPGRRRPARGFVGGVMFAVLFGLPGAGEAQFVAPETSRFFIDLNVGGAERSLAGERRFDSRFVWFGELGAGRATYPKPSRGRFTALADVSGGVMVTSLGIGIGIGYTRASADAVVGLDVTVPHPSFLDAEAGASGATSRPLTRRESAWYLTAVATALRAGPVEVRVSGGPAFITYAAEMVSDVSYAQAFHSLAPEQTVTITGFSSETVEHRTVGVQLGADLTYLVTPALGVGAGVRFTHGTLTLEAEPMSRVRQELRVGSTLGFVGLRVRFGR